MASTEIREIAVLLRLLFVPDTLIGIKLNYWLLNLTHITEIVAYWVNVLFKNFPIQIFLLPVIMFHLFLTVVV